MYPDITNCTVAGKPATSVLDRSYYEKDFIPRVQQRGAEIIQARKLSSAASAGSSALDHVRDWVKGSGDEWVSMAVPSDGSYGIPEGVLFSYPCLCPGDGTYKIVEGLKIDEFSRAKLDATKEELMGERTAVEDMC